MSELRAYEFEQCLADPWSFRFRDKHSNNIRVILGTHVDDMVLIGRVSDCESSAGFCVRHSRTINWEKLRFIRDTLSVEMNLIVP